MRKIDHVRKTVYIIVGCLTIVSLVLTICHKVGHCASSENSSGVNSYPLPFGLSSGYGFTSEQEQLLSSLDFDTLIATCESVRSADYDSVCLIDYSSSSVYQLGFYNSSWLITLDSDVLTTSSVCNIGSGSSQITATVLFNNGNVDWWYGNNWGQSIFIGSHLTAQPNGSYSLNSNEFISGYPIYSEVDTFSTGVGTEVFTYGSGGGDFTGHSKGGVLTNYIDSDDLIEQDSSLPTVDTTSPADPSSNSGWFQKILNGLSKINQSIKGGVLTIGDYIGQGFENIINWLTEPFDQEAFSDELDQVFLLSDILGAKDLLDQSGLFDWEDITPSQNVSWTFDFGGAVLPHTSCTIDFSWYTGTVKNLIVTLICTFLVVGLLATLFNSIPSIISGHSGDKGGGSDS